MCLNIKISKQIKQMCECGGGGRYEQFSSICGPR